MGTFSELYESCNHLGTNSRASLTEKAEMVKGVTGYTGILDLMYTYGQRSAEQAKQILLQERGDAISDSSKKAGTHAFEYQGDKFTITVQPDKISRSETLFSFALNNESERKTIMTGELTMKGAHSPKSVGVKMAQKIIDKLNL